MSGLSNQKSFKKKSWRTVFLMVSILYLIVVSALTVAAYNLPDFYAEMNRRRIERIKEEVADAIFSNEAETQKKLDKALESDQFELIVLNESGFEYTTIDTTDFNQISNHVKESVLSYKNAYIISADDENFQVWLGVYEIRNQNFFEAIVLVIVISVLILLGILTVLIFLSFSKLIAPIRRLQEKIERLKNYDFTGNEEEKRKKQSEYDELSESLSEFSIDLRGKMDTIGTQYTALEKELREEQEKLIYKDQLVGSIIHDLKTPIHMTQLKMEHMHSQLVLLEGHDDKKLYYETIKDLEEMMKDHEAIMGEVKSAVDIVHEKNKEIPTEKVDVVAILKDTIKRFNTLLKKKKINYDIEAPRALKVNMNEIELKQILHNVVSNIAQYTQTGGTFEIQLYDEEEQLFFEAYNDVSSIENIDFEHVFDLFYRNVKHEDFNGNGIGMFTIQKMVEKYHGSCSFKAKGNGVELKIQIPIGSDFHE